MAKKKAAKRKTTKKKASPTAGRTKSQKKTRRKAKQKIAPTGKSASKRRKVQEEDHGLGQKGFPIVGIGASAGGLAALRTLLEAMPDDPGVAIVVIQHLDPTRKSLAPELLAKCTKMEVAQVTDAPSIKQNRVYVIPPDKYLSISNSELHLSDPDRPRGSRMAIDFFLRSLAKDQHQCAVGVILSGSGTDGTLGIKSIKTAGGLVIAQEPRTADHDGMPRSAIESGVVDHILPPEKMPEVLVKYARHPYVREGPAAAPAEAEQESVKADAGQGFEAIVSLLRTHTQHDFRNYKEKTLVRRTRRRMCLHHIDDYNEYLKYLRQHPEEVKDLAKDMLIAVTDFFREPEAWEQLRALVIQPMVAKKEPDEPIRVWTPGCATGEEPYSVAMLILEQLKHAGKTCPLNVFASDIDMHALQYARSGRYPKSIATDVSQARIDRFFTATDGDDYFHVNKILREAVVFADQNLIADPPFSKLDLVCCRNLLIYLKAEVQEKIVALFHFALLDGGVLFLGSAETVGRQTDLFETLHKRWRIFRRVGPTRHNRVDIPISDSPRRHQTDVQPIPPQRRETRATNLAQQCLLDVLAPSAVLIDKDWRILYISGDVNPYLIHKPGIPSDDLLEKARRGLRSKLRVAVQSAFSHERSVAVKARVQRGSAYYPISVSIRVIRDRQQDETLALVMFQEDRAGFQPTDQDPAKPSSTESTERAKDGSADIATRDDDLDEHVVIRQLEEDLAATKFDLRSTVEQLESSNEEYKASNEEVMSINEELQSTNEELETSKEELQSLNEELSTVNGQLAAKVEELETKHSDLENLLTATDVATLCLDTDLAVRWFTPAIQQVIRLTATDRGRPIGDFSHDFTDSSLVETARRVLKTLTPIEDEVVCHDGRAFLRRVLPYRTDDHHIAGIMITFVDITRRKLQEQQIRHDAQRFRVLFDNSPSFLWEEDWSNVRRCLDGLKAQGVTEIARHFKDHPEEVADCLRRVKLTAANKASIRFFEATDEPTLLANLQYLIAEESFDVIAGLLGALADGKLEYSDEEYVVTLTGNRKCVIFCFQVVPGYEKTLERVIVSLVDVTSRKHAEQALRELNESLEQQISQRTEMLRLLQNVTRIANEASTVNEAMLAAMERISQFNGWQVGHVWRRADDSSGDMIDTNIWHVSEHADLAIGRLKELQHICEQSRYSPGEILIGAVAKSGKPLWIDDIVKSRDRRRGNAERLGLHAVIAFPITVNGVVVAVMEFFSDHPAKRDPRFMEIMPDVGIQLGHLIERKRLEKLAAEATEAEQRRIGSDIHDGVGQELTGLRYMAQTHAETLAEQSSSEVRTAQRMAEWLETVQGQLRDIIRELVPVEIDEHGLVAALRGLGEQMTEAHDLVCSLECAHSIRVPDAALATHLYRITQEAVRNAVRHARTHQIRIRLIEDDGSLTLQVEDDGVGITPMSDPNVGFGLRSMAYRAGLIGADFNCQPKEGGGTRVTCTVLRV